jgi:amidohydrolase
MMSILDEAFNLKQYMIEQRNYFHIHPELSLQEFNTSRHIQDELTKIGIEYKIVEPTNVIAQIDSGKPGKTIFLRADIDALPIHEKNETAYKSQNEGIMHACGHDGHIAYLLGTAKILLNHKSELNGKVILCFQSAEEIGKGARDIIENGILDNVDRIFGIHFEPEISVGKYIIKSGADMASCDRFKITVHGKSAHITSPQNAADSLFIGALIATQLQTVVSRLVSPAEGALIGIGSFHSGTTYNIIPGLAVLEGTIRSFSTSTRNKLIQTVKKISNDIAEAYGGSVDIIFEDICDPCINSTEETTDAIIAAKKIVNEQNIISNTEKKFMSDNFADYNRKAPGVYVHAGSSDDKMKMYPLHSEYFDLSQDCYSYAAALASQYTIDYLSR